jgi:ABC-type polysaccharide/polyol phosphate export permease
MRRHRIAAGLLLVSTLPLIVIGMTAVGEVYPRMQWLWALLAIAHMLLAAVGALALAALIDEVLDRRGRK